MLKSGDLSFVPEIHIEEEGESGFHTCSVTSAHMHSCAHMDTHTHKILSKNVNICLLHSPCRPCLLSSLTLCCVPRGLAPTEGPLSLRRPCTLAFALTPLKCMLPRTPETLEANSGNCSPSPLDDLAGCLCHLPPDMPSCPGCCDTSRGLPLMSAPLHPSSPSFSCTLLSVFGVSAMPESCCCCTTDNGQHL